ncbi:MAG TPA: DNA-binding protein [Actinobacteria bacterium]|jgi:hypothetical protein|nr:DNA-binding protein [Actinomycetota bacterium]
MFPIVRFVSSESAPDFPSGVSAPAIRAFTAAGYRNVRELAGVPAGELAQLHGVGPKALRIVQAALEAEGQSLA